MLGFLLYWGGIRLNLGAFFKWTSLFILLVAAGLAAGAIRAFHEAGLWNHFQDVAFDFSGTLTTHSLFGTLMEGIFGYQEAPSVSEVTVWLLYLLPALALFSGRRERQTRHHVSPPEANSFYSLKGMDHDHYFSP